MNVELTELWTRLADQNEAYRKNCMKKSRWYAAQGNCERAQAYADVAKYANRQILQYRRWARGIV